MTRFLVTNDRSIQMQFRTVKELSSLVDEVIFISTVISLPAKMHIYKPVIVIMVQQKLEKHFFDVVYEINNNIRLPQLNLLLISDLILDEFSRAQISDILPLNYNQSDLIELVNTIINNAAELDSSYVREWRPLSFEETNQLNEETKQLIEDKHIKLQLENQLNLERIINVEKQELREAFASFNEQLYEGIDFSIDVEDVMHKYITGNQEDTFKMQEHLNVLFRELYREVSAQLVSSSFIPLAKRLFLRYGIMDVRLLNDRIIDFLCSNPYSNVNNLPVYYVDEWLAGVYKGEREISFVDEIRHKLAVKEYGNIEGDKAIAYELETLSLMSKIVSGRKGRRIYLLDKANFAAPPSEIMCTREKVFETFNHVQQAIDPTIFQRATLYGIRHIPSVFLIVPGYGRYSYCWQTWEKQDRDFGPARIVCPLVSQKSVEENVLGGLASYRWEYVKNTYVTSWDREGLIADYSRIYAKAKGEMNERFIKDYITWVTKEAMNRTILSKEIRRLFWVKMPFSEEIIESLKDNMSFSDLYLSHIKDESVM